MQKIYDLVVLLLVLLSAALLATPILAEAVAMAPSTNSTPHQHIDRQGADRPSGQSRPALPRRSSSGGRTSAFLPMVFGGRRPACSEQSPFSLEIAALHQVAPGAAGIPRSEEMSSGGWQAQQQGPFPTLTEALKRSGACWTRVRVDWSEIQAEPPDDTMYWAYHDEKLRLVAESGVQLIVIVDGVPEWAGDLDHGPINPERMGNFRQFLTKLVARYKEPPYNVHHWELFNEPDHTGLNGIQAGWGLVGDRYAQMLAVAYPAIKAVDPQATVLMGGLAYDWFTEYQGPFYRYFPDEVIAAGGGAYLDVINFHYFPDFSEEWERWDPNSDSRRNGRLPAPTCGLVDDAIGTVYEAGGIDLIAKASHFRNRLATCYDLTKPAWVTELAMNGYDGNPASLAEQARYVIQGYARGLAAGVENITWYALVSPPYDPYDQGLLYRHSWAPKPAYYAYQTMTRELAGYTYAYTLEADGMEAYVFRDLEQRERTVAWSRDPEEPALLVFAGASGLRVVDRNGSVMFVQDGGAGDVDGRADGKVSLKLSREPLFVSREIE